VTLNLPSVARELMHRMDMEPSCQTRNGSAASQFFITTPSIPTFFFFISLFGGVDRKGMIPWFGLPREILSVGGPYSASRAEEIATGRLGIPLLGDGSTRQRAPRGINSKQLHFRLDRIPQMEQRRSCSHFVVTVQSR